VQSSVGCNGNFGFLRSLVGSIALPGYQAKTEEARATIATQASCSIDWLRTEVLSHKWEKRN
jgi:hypothetical protein